MTCPHCKSTDLIKVQDHFFCLSCGQILLTSTVKASQMTKVKKGPGRPRAAGLDIPRKPVGAFVGNPDSVLDNSVRPLPQRVETPISPSKPLRRSPKAIPSVDLLLVLQGSVFALAPLLVLFAVPGATSILLGLTLLAYNHVPSPRFFQYGAAIGLILSGVLWLSLIRAVTIVYRAAIHDHRLVSIREAWSVAVRRGHKLVLWRLWFLLQLMLAVGVVGIAVHYGEILRTYPSYIQLSAVFIISFIALGVMAISWVRHGLTEAALTLGELQLPRARRTARLISRRRFELMGIKIFGLMFWASVPGIVYTGVTLSSFTTNKVHALSLITAACMVTIIGYTLTSAGASGEMYRELVATGLPDEMAALYGGKRSVRVTKLMQLRTISFVLVPAVTGIGLYVYAIACHVGY
jgi:hypothetical protein